MRRLTQALLISLGLIANAASNAATFTGSAWQEGETTFNVNFSVLDPTLVSNGTPDFDAAFIEAANQWSNNSTFRYIIDTGTVVDPCNQASNSRLNGARFSADLCGTNFQSSTLAVARTFSSSGVNIRTDIVFNTAFSWDVYNGGLQTSQDFRRVAVHELGHSLGLDHEVNAPAIMQPSISNTIETPQADDIGGVATLYDADNDGVGLFQDNCPDNANSDQTNTDSPFDNLGDVCDPDIDNDGIVNSVGVDQQLSLNSATNNFFSFGDGNTGASFTDRFAQTFTSNVAGTIDEIQVPITCSSGDLQIQLLKLTSDTPQNSDQVVDSTVLAQGASGSPNSFATLTLGTFDANTGMTTGAYTTSVGEQLAIVARSSGECGWFNIGTNPTPPSYTRGAAFRSVNEGSWAAFNGDSSFDFPFATIVRPTTPDNCPLIANSNQQDTDGDGIGDACEVINDLDNDNIDDAVDNCPAIPNPNQANLDNDAQGDACDLDDDGDNINDTIDNCPVDANPNQANLDLDSQGDVCDLDDDGDNINDTVDNCPVDANPNQANLDLDSQGDVCDLDDDGDNINDTVDNCPVDANPNQANLDLDAQGDVCDLDDDGDNVNDSIDNCPVNSNSDQADLDLDNEGDVCDADVDGDSVADNIDNCPINSNSDQSDLDTDSLGDACDLDDDGDGIDDTVDNCPVTSNVDQADEDLNNVGDVCEVIADDDNQVCFPVGRTGQLAVICL